MRVAERQARITVMRDGPICALLREKGMTAESLDRVHVPIGLEGGAETPAEPAPRLVTEIGAAAFGTLDGCPPFSLSRTLVPEGDDPR